MLRSKLQKWKKFSSLPTLRLQIWIIFNSYSPSSNHVILTVGQTWGCFLPFPTLVHSDHHRSISAKKTVQIRSLKASNLFSKDNQVFAISTVRLSPLLVQFILHGYWAIDRPLWPNTVHFRLNPISDNTTGKKIWSDC